MDIIISVQPIILDVGYDVDEDDHTAFLLSPSACND